MAQGPGWYGVARGRVHHWADRLGLTKARCGRTVLAQIRFPGQPPTHGRLCAACLRAVTGDEVDALILEVLGPEALDFMDRSDRR